MNKEEKIQEIKNRIKELYKLRTITIKREIERDQELLKKIRQIQKEAINESIIRSL